jgi:hypothetical protein
MKSAANQYEAGDKKDHYQAKNAGQAMGFAHDRQNGTVAVNQVKKSQVKQVKHVRAEKIADGQPGSINQSYRAYAIKKLGQRGQRSNEDKAYPDSTKASFLSNNVAVSSHFPAR